MIQNHIIRQLPMALPTGEDCLDFALLFAGGISVVISTDSFGEGKTPL